MYSSTCHQSDLLSVFNSESTFRLIFVNLFIKYLTVLCLNLILSGNVSHVHLFKTVIIPLLLLCLIHSPLWTASQNCVILLNNYIYTLTCKSYWVNLTNSS